MNQSQLDEQRNRARFVYEHSILCFRCLKVDTLSLIQVPFLFNIVDISHSGLGISCNQRIKPKTIIIFNLINKSTIREFKAEVKWCKYTSSEHTNSRYKCGVHFLDLIYDDIIFLNEIIRCIR